MLTYDEAWIEARLTALTPAGRAQFALRCAALLAPAFAAWILGESKILDVAALLARIEACPPRTEADRMAAEIREAMPDEDRWGPGAAVAQSGAIALIYAITTGQTGSVEDATFAARQVWEAADSVVNDEVDVDWNDPQAATLILSHPHMQSTLDWLQTELEAASGDEDRPG